MMGQRDDIQALCLDINQSPDIFADKLQSLLKQTNDKELIIMADIAGGTPANVTVKLWQQYPHVTIISGLNLPMVLAYIKHSTQDALAEKLIQTGIDSIINISEQARLYYTNPLN